MPEFRFDHVAIAVREIEPALRLYRDVLGGEYLGDGDEGGTYRWAQVRYPGGGKVELLEPVGDGFLSRFLDSRGEGLHHITFKTDDIEAAIDLLEAQGFELVDVQLDDPRWKEAFLRPSKNHKTLVQVAQPGAPSEDAEDALHSSNLEELQS